MVESAPAREYDGPEFTKNPPVLKVKIAHPPLVAFLDKPKYDALIVPHPDKKGSAWIEMISSASTSGEHPEVIIALDRQNPVAVDAMCDLIDIVRNWELSADESFNQVLRWGSMIQEHEIKNNREGNDWLQETCKKYSLPPPCTSSCCEALQHSAPLFHKPLRAVIASDGIFVHCFISGVGVHEMMQPRLLKKVVSNFSAHALLIIKRGDECHICVIESIERDGMAAKRPLCVMICDLSQRVLNKKPIAS